ncbi:MAG TPA: amino acid permease [Chloroflexi bacterium]|nr:amino acid permease [Chloroflexota bacterium]
MHTETEEGKLIRELGLKEGLAIGLGTMIGAGIFVLPAIAAERAGQAAALSYLLAGLLCLPVAMIVSELATGMPRAGGSYTFIAQALGPFAGSIVGPANWLGLTFANGFYLIAAGQYLALLLPVPSWSGAILMGFLFTLLNYRGAKISGRVQNVVVVILVVVLAIFVVVGLVRGAEIPRQPFVTRGWGAVIGTVGLIIVSFTGFEKISTIAEEIKDPGRNLPLAIVGAVSIATVLYVLIVLVATGLMPSGAMDIQRGLLVEAAWYAAGPIGQAVMIGAALLATLSSANAAVMASSRIGYGMGRDRVLPGWFSYTHPRFKTPANGILFSGILGTLLALSGKAETLAEISSALFMVSYALLCVSVVVMRRARRRWYRPSFRVPLYPILPIVTAILCLGVILTMDPLSRIAGVVLVALSLIWYAVWVRRQAVVIGQIGPLWERERPLEGVIEAAEAAVRGDRQNEILIPLIEESDPASLLTIATALALADEHTVINLLDITVVPEQVPLELAEAQLRRRQGTKEYALAQMAAQAAAQGVPVRTLRRAARGFDSGTLAIIESRPAVGLVLMSWQDALSPGSIYGSPVKRILEQAQCDVAILRARQLPKPQNILIPVSGGPHARLGLQLAFKITQGDQGKLTVLRIVTPSDDLDVEVEVDSLRGMITDIVGSAGDEVRARVVVHESVADAILEEVETGGYDLLVIGASNEWRVKSLLIGALPDVIADRALCSVLMVRRYESSGISTTRRILSSIRGWK